MSGFCRTLLASALIVALHCGTAARSLAQGIDTTVNQIGRLTSAGNGKMRRYFEYDFLGRVAREMHVLEGAPYVYQMTYGYPQATTGVSGPGSVTARYTFPDGEAVAYTYDAAGQLQTVHAGGQAVVTAIRHNARSQATEVVFGNGARSVRSYRDGGDLRLAGIRTCLGAASASACLAAAAPAQSYQLSHDDSGNVTGVVDEVVGGTYSATYAYDSLDQLRSQTTAGTTNAYEYDSIGNLTLKEGVLQSYAPPACTSPPGCGPHALGRAGSSVYTYDFNGNVVSTSDGLRLTWNAENMATEVARGAVSATKEFFGERAWKRVDGGATTYFLPSARLEDGRWRKYYGDFAERSAEDGRLRFYHPDQLGSSTVMTEGSTVAHRSAFRPFGADVDQGGGSFVPKLRFNRKEMEPTGTYDYGARLYDPRTGRWLSADDDKTDGFNGYAYVRNNPVTLVDPDGHQSCDPRSHNISCVTGKPGGPLPINGGPGELESCVAGICKSVINGVTAFVNGRPSLPWIDGNSPRQFPLQSPSNEMQATSMRATDFGLLLIQLRFLRRSWASASVVDGANRGVRTARTEPSRSRSGAVGAFHNGGQTFIAGSVRKRHGTPNWNAIVQSDLDSIPSTRRSTTHAKCAEPGCFSQSLNAGKPLRGGVFMALETHTRIPLDPCSTCRVLVERYGVKLTTPEQVFRQYLNGAPAVWRARPE